MSKEVSIFRDQKAITVGAPQGIDEITKRLLGGSGLDIKRISIKNGKWNMMLRGEKIATSTDPTLDVVIVNAAEHVSRLWYKEGYTGKSAGAPDCSSNDGVKPDAGVKSPQGSTCEKCPQNIAGTGTNGKGRACRYARRLAVTLAGDLAGDVYQVQLPPTSLFGKAPDENHMGLDAYVRHLAGYNFSITGVVTEMRFDPNSDSPKLYFRGVRQLNEAERLVVAEQGQSEVALAAVRYTPGAIDTGPVEAEEPSTPFRDAPVQVEEEEEEEELAPTPAPVEKPKRTRKAAAPAPVVNKGFTPVNQEEEEEEEEEEAPAPAPVAKAPGGFVSTAPKETAEPVVVRSAAKSQPPAAKVDMAKLVEDWDLDDE